MRHSLLLCVAAFATLALASLATCAPASDEQIKDAFAAWRVRHNKVYVDEAELQHRYALFRNRFLQIEEHNANPANSYKRESKSAMKVSFSLHACSLEAC